MWLVLFTAWHPSPFFVPNWPLKAKHLGNALAKTSRSREKNPTFDSFQKQTFFLTVTEDQKSWVQKTFHINKNLLPLKLTLFFFSASAFSILPYLTIHMKDIGISVEHIALMYAVLPFTIFFAPPLVGFMADKLVRKSQYFKVSFFRQIAMVVFILAIAFSRKKSTFDFFRQIVPAFHFIFRFSGFVHSSVDFDPFWVWCVSYSVTFLAIHHRSRASTLIIHFCIWGQFDTFFLVWMRGCCWRPMPTISW